MKSFLEEIAEKIIASHPRLNEVTLVLPNRRASLFLRKYLAMHIRRPAFAPAIYTIEEFIAGFSTWSTPDKLTLIHHLYLSYHDTVSDGTPTETFDQFFFWGEMLLRDFDELDKYMVDAKHLFMDLSHLKTLDASFDYLTPEQMKFLQEFWSHFQEHDSSNKRRFLGLWQLLLKVYEKFREKLSQNSIAYEGMLQRSVAEKIETANTESRASLRHLKFVGFNALTAVEEKIISFFVANKNSEVYWDVDQYYLNDVTQEAGRFFRQYQNHPVLGKTFSSTIPAGLSAKRTGETGKLKLFYAAQPIGQAKLMAEILAKQVASGMDPENTLVVLPDEKLLLPVMHGVASSVEKLNVTMGFSLSATPLFNLVEILIELQISARDEHFNHRQVLAVLGHPYIVAADPVSANNKRKEILKHNWVSIPRLFLATEVDIHRVIFREVVPPGTAPDATGSLLAEYLLEIVTHVGGLQGLSDVDREFAFHFYKILGELKSVLNVGAAGPAEPSKKTNAPFKSFLRLFRQVARSGKIPFSGEPLKGLQVMGVLETRNLDFKNVFVLSLNEGTFPSTGGKGSYIPFNLRRAYGLPIPEHQDAIYSYLFYRVLQRAENIFLFCNSETDLLGQGETSRYLQQLIYESGIPVERSVLNNPVQPAGLKPLKVVKNDQVMEDLLRVNQGNNYFQGISPSALNAYLECRLKFYFRHVAKIKEPNEVEEELDARVLGNFLHLVMEKFYKHIHARKGSRQVEAEDFRDYPALVDKLIDEVFIEAYRLDPESPVIYEGQRLVVKEMVKTFTHRILEIDKAYAPFMLEAIEMGGLTYRVAIDHPPFFAMLGGKIDRVDRKQDVLRVIDYKTGKDTLAFDSIDSLFSRDENRNKAAFQTLLYALLYKKNFGSQNGEPERIVPGLINRMNLFDETFSFGLRAGRESVEDAGPVLPQFEDHLRLLFNEIFDPAVSFDQTHDALTCRTCAYSSICYR